LTLYVGPPPATGFILGSDSVCVGGTATLSDTTAPGGIWTSSQDTLASIDSNSGVVTGVSVGFVIITYTVHNAFGSSIITHVEYIGKRPVITIVAPSTVSLGINTGIKGYPDGGTFTVSNGANGAFVGQSDSAGVYAIGYYIATRSGPNTIHYSVHTPCGDADSSFFISVPTAGVNSINSNSSVLNVYPNPNTGAFGLTLTSQNTESASVVITNLVGEKVKELTISTNTTTNIQLEQPTGIYFISASTTGGKYTAKISITN